MSAINVTTWGWTQEANLTPVKWLPGYAVESIRHWQEDEAPPPRVRSIEQGFVVYECISEVHMVTNEHGDHDECSWLPLLNRKGKPWEFPTVGTVNTALLRIKESKVESSAKASD